MFNFQNFFNYFLSVVLIVFWTVIMVIDIILLIFGIKYFHVLNANYWLFIFWGIQIVLLFLGVIFTNELYRSMIKKQAPFVRSHRKIWSVLESEIDFTPNKIFYDLGCGDGCILFSAESRGLIAKGYEIGTLPLTIAKLKKFFLKSKAEIIPKDFLQADISDGDYIYLYLGTDTLSKIQDNLLNQVKKNTIIICNTFAFKKIKPYKVVDVFSKRKTDKKLYLYKLN